MDRSKLFWNAVKLKSEELGITQRQISDYLGLYPSTYRNMIHHGTMPRLDQGMMIADFLKTDVYSLYPVEVAHG